MEEELEVISEEQKAQFRDLYKKILQAIEAEKDEEEA